MSNDLTKQHCTPCEGHEDPLNAQQAQEKTNNITGWELIKDSTAIQKEYQHDDFRAALAFVNEVGDVAEAEGHHPDILIHSYNKVQITLATHAIGGLSENDFILAAKIDDIVDQQ